MLTLTFNKSYESSHVSHFTWSGTVAAAVGESNEGDHLFCDRNNKVPVGGSGAIYYADDAASVSFYNNDVYPDDDNSRSGGFSVRLVTECQ